MADTLTPRELATERGVSLKTVYRWMWRKGNPLPHTRAPGRGTVIRIEREAMERWFAEPAPKDEGVVA